MTKIGYEPRDRLPFAEEVNRIFPANVHSELADWFRVSTKTISMWVKHGIPKARAVEWEDFKKMHSRAIRQSK